MVSTLSGDVCDCPANPLASAALTVTLIIVWSEPMLTRGLNA